MRALALLMLLFFTAGCESTPVEPSSPATDTEAWFTGSYDGAEFVLQRAPLEDPPGGIIELDLIVSRSRFDPETNQLRVTVHLRNSSDFHLDGRALVGLSGFDPESVHPVNAVVHDDEPDRWWYDYYDALGDDRILAPEEYSEGLEWVLQLPGPGSFSFAAVARFSVTIAPGLLAGHVYVDTNRSGERDSDEPAGHGQIEVARGYPYYPVMVDVDESGDWSMPIYRTGVYSVRWLPPPAAAAPFDLCTTTANPRQVVIMLEEPLAISSYTRADFGIDPEPCADPKNMTIILLSGTAEDAESDPWTFVGVRQLGRYDGDLARLEFTLGISGCTSTHGMELGIEVPDEEAIEASRMTATVLHNDYDEPCDAYLHTKRRVTIYTLRKHWEVLTGLEGPAELELVTADGPVIIEIQ